MAFSATFSQLLRFSQARNVRPLTAAGMNYLVAAAVCLVWVFTARSHWTLPSTILGSVAGVTYVSSLLLILPCMRLLGVSLVGALTQLSMMTPAVVSIWRFGERPSPFQWAGVALAVLALPLLSFNSAIQAPELKRTRPSALPGWLFLSTSISQLMMKEFSATRPDAELPLYSAALFVAACLATVAWVRLTGATGRARDVPARPVPEWPVGLALGAANVLQVICLMMALDRLPAVVVFPASASLGILVNAGASLLLWKERPNRAGWAGISAAALAVVMLTLR